MSEIRCLAVPVAQLDAVWPKARPLLAPAVATASRKLIVDDILTEARRGVYVLWVVFIGESLVAALTTRVVEYPQRRALAIDWLGGKRMREWLAPVLHAMKGHARRNACLHLEGYGRRAWGRWLGPHGWEPEYVAYRMELDDG